MDSWKTQICACFLPVVNGDWLSNHSWSLFLLSSHLFKKLGSVIILSYLTGVLTDISPLIGRLYQLISDETRLSLIFRLTLRLVPRRSCVIYGWKSRINLRCPLSFFDMHCLKAYECITKSHFLICDFERWDVVLAMVQKPNGVTSQ